MIGRIFDYIAGRSSALAREKAVNAALARSLDAMIQSTSILSGKIPGQWSSDHAQESRQCKGWVYSAVTTIADQVSQAMVVPDDLDTATRLEIKSPNPDQTFAQFMYHRTLQLCLTGVSVVWNLQTEAGLQRYSIPTAILQPTVGGWRVALQSAAAGAWATYTPRMFSLLAEVLPYEQVSVVRFPHPYYLGDGLSPVSACATWIDSANQIDESRYYCNENAARPGGVFTEKEGIDAEPADRERWLASITAQNSGSSNRGKNMYVPGPLNWQPWANTPIELDHFNSFLQLRDAIFAVYRVPLIAAGVGDAGTHSAFYAALMQLSELRVQPILNHFAEEDRRALHELDLPETFGYKAKRIDDPDVIDRKARLMKETGAFSVNEIRKVVGYEPILNPLYDLPLGSNKDDVELPGGQMDERSTGIRQ